MFMIKLEDTLNVNKTLIFSQEFWLSDYPAVPGTHGPVVVPHVLRVAVPELHVSHDLQLDTKQRTQ